MFVLLLMILIFAQFHRELLCALVRYLSHARLAPEGNWDIAITARFRKRPAIYLMASPLDEFLAIDTLLSRNIFVNEKLWELLNEEEKESLVCWGTMIFLRSSVAGRLFFSKSPHVTDRDALTYSTRPLSFLTMFEKVYYFRKLNSLTTFGSVLSGLTLLGPSVFHEWPPYEERLKAATRAVETYLADLNKSQ